jgi:hypothetical protein
VPQLPCFDLCLSLSLSLIKSISCIVRQRRHDHQKPHENYSHFNFNVLGAPIIHHCPKERGGAHIFFQKTTLPPFVVSPITTVLTLLILLIQLKHKTRGYLYYIILMPNWPGHISKWGGGAQFSLTYASLTLSLSLVPFRKKWSKAGNHCPLLSLLDSWGFHVKLKLTKSQPLHAKVKGVFHESQTRQATEMTTISSAKSWPSTHTRYLLRGFQGRSTVGTVGKASTSSGTGG